MATIDDDDRPIRRNRRPSHPGAILKGLFIDPAGVSIAEMARIIGVSTKHLSQIVHGHARISPGIAGKLGRVFGSGETIWLQLQADVDAWDADQEQSAWTPSRTFTAQLELA